MPISNIVKDLDQDLVVFDYKPRELNIETTQVAKDYVAQEDRNEFKISELVAKQVGISKLESEANEDKINERVLERLKEIQEKAYKEGYDLGLIDGVEKAYQEEKVTLQERLSNLDQFLKTMEQQKKLILIDNEAELISLVFQVAKKIALRDLAENREAVLEILKPLVEELHGDEKITVRVSSDDLYFLQTLRDKTGQAVEKLEKIKFIDDEKMRSGGCILETAYGSVDASVEERVERVWQTLQSRVPQKTGGEG